MRRSGILMPVFSLPSDYGTGCFSKEAKDFISKLEQAEQSIWQILPLNPTAYGNSPYQSPSAFAGNPYFIDIDTLFAEGLLKRSELLAYKSVCPKGGWVDYKFLHETRYGILKKAFDRFRRDEPGYREFIEKERYWLDDYCLFCAIKRRFGFQPFSRWTKDIRLHKENALKPFIKELSEETELERFLQYQFMKQWRSIRAFAAERGVSIMGDMPIYTAFDSADCWSRRELFAIDGNGALKRAAACPPDRFSPKGQLWGNPVYNWAVHAENGYDWWIKRMKRAAELYDIVRLDHFRGFESFYSVSAAETTGQRGVWEKGPGAELFDAVKRECPGLELVAEDLGFITEDVKRLLTHTGYPGMRVLQFAFTEGGGDHLPHNYNRNSVVYTGTHDNHTAAGWFKSAPEKAVSAACRYMNLADCTKDAFCNGFIRLAMGSVADTCIIPVQDCLQLGDECRINIPGRIGCWQVRMGEDELCRGIGGELRKITRLYGRGKSKGDSAYNV